MVGRIPVSFRTVLIMLLAICALPTKVWADPPTQGVHPPPANVSVNSFRAQLAAAQNQEEMNRVLDRWHMRQLPVEQVERVAANAEQLSIEQLEKGLKRAEDLYTTSKKKWEFVRQWWVLYSYSATMVEGRFAAHMLEFAEVGEAHQETREDIRQREEFAFHQRYGSYLTGVGHGTPEQLAEWKASEEYRRFRQEEEEADKWRIRERERITETMAHGRPGVFNAIEALQKRTLKEYKGLINSIPVIREVLKRKREGKQRREAQEAEEERRRAALRFSTPRTRYELKTGETVDVWFNISHGSIPYYFFIHIGETKFVAEDDVARPGWHAHPFGFEKPGRYGAVACVMDYHGEQRTIDLDFHVTGEPIVPPDDPPPDDGPPDDPEPPSPPDDPPPKPTAQPTTPPPTKGAILTGRFRARLWGPAYTVPGIPRPLVKVRSDNDHTPLIISIDASGQITGRAEYTLPREKLALESTSAAHDCRIEFELTGSCDPKTGETTLNLSRGKRQYAQKQTDGDIFEYRTEYETRLRGWRTRGPKDAALAASPLVKTLQGAQDKPFVPRTLVGPDGDAVFQQDGFIGVRGMAEGGPATTQTITRHEQGSITSRGANLTDRTESARQMVSQSEPPTWFLEILGPAGDDEIGEPELVAFGVFPRPTVQLAFGKRRQFRAKGVYSNNVFKVKDLTNEATWRETKGLTRATDDAGNLVKGLYLMESGETQGVRAGMRKGIDWMKDTVRIVPAPGKPAEATKP
jgi:hypothetical protein